METRIAHDALPLFVYGTLQFPEICRTLLGRSPAGVPVTVPGWRAAALERRPYPGLVEAPGRSAPGLLLSGLTAGEWKVLDDFEGSEYVLREVEPAHGGRVWAYVWCGGDIRAETWDPEVYAERCLAAYVADRH